MKALVIGGNRYFGRRLVERLAADPANEIHVLNRGRLPNVVAPNVRALVGDRADPNALERLTEGLSFDVVFDQVAYEAQHARDAIEIFRGRVGHYVLTSSQSVYFGMGEALAEEKFNARDYAFSHEAASATEYPEAKRQCEAVFARAGFPLCAVRFPIVLGEDDPTDRLRWHMRRLVRGEGMFFPNLDAELNFISSADAAQALLTVANRSVEGPLNAAPRAPISLARLLQLLEATTGKGAVFAPSPASGAESPFGVEQSWTMDVSRAERAGLAFDPWRQWLPELARSDFEKIASAR